MAGNPLYPGYVPNPKDDPINPLYPGYFPGQAEVRPPRGPDIKPNEFNFNQITEIIDHVAADYMLAGPGMPRWVVDRALDDFKQNLKVSIKPAGVNQEDLDDYDVNSLPGAFGINVNLNPMDWINDPQKTATKTLQGWWKSGVSWKDIEQRYRVEAWRQVFNENAPAKFDFGVAERFGVGVLGANIGAAVGLQYEEVNNPLQLEKRKELNVPETDQKKGAYQFSDIELDPSGNVRGIRSGASPTVNVDLGKKFGTSIQEFEIMGGFGSKREEKFDAVAYNGYKTVVIEMENHSAAKSIVAGTSAEAASRAAALTAARTRLNIMDSMEDIGFEFGEYLKNTRKDVLKDIYKKAEDKVGLDFKNASKLYDKIQINLAKIDNEVDRLSRNVATKAEADFIKRKYIANYSEQVDSILKHPVLQLAHEAKLDPSKEGAIKEQLKKMDARTAINGLSGRFDGGFISRPLSGGEPFAPSLQRIFLRDSLQDVDRPGLRGSIAIGNLVDDVVHADPKAASQIVKGAINFTRNEAQTMGAMEVLDSLESGEFMEKYIWPRVKNYWSASTPGAYADRFLKRNHYFGLNLSSLEDLAEKGGSGDLIFEGSVFYKAANLIQQPFGGGREDKVGTIAQASLNPSKSVPNAIYGNWFTVSGSVPLAGGGAIGIRAKLYGGDHFKAVSKLNDWLEKKSLSVSDLDKVLAVTDAKSLAALAGKISATHLPAGVKADAEGLKKFAEEISGFKKWVDDNEHRILVNGVTKGTPEYYAALINLLNAQNINPDFKALGITRRYVGQLEKLYYGLNSAQSAVLKKWGKAIAPIAYARKVVSDYLAMLLTQAIALASGAVSGGALYAFIMSLEKPIRFIINAIIGKAVEISKVFYNAIVKADLDVAFKYIDKTVEKYAKITLGVIGAFTMLFILPADKFMGTMAVSFSPVDNTVGGGIGDNFSSSGIHLGSGIDVRPLASKPSNVSDVFVFVDLDEVLLGLDWKVSPWPAEWKARMETAIQALQDYSGGYLKRLGDPSVGGTINLVWAEPIPIVAGEDGGYCGYTTGKGNFTGNDLIIMGHGYCYDGSNVLATAPWYYNYLFAHETAHVYSNRYPEDSFEGLTFGSVRSGGEETLPTYAGCPTENDVGEDYAETFGDFIQINTYDCGTDIPSCAAAAGNPEQCYTDFWAKYPNHFEYADKVFTRP